MVILSKRSFYFGALLHDALDHGTTALLIESNAHRSIYQCTTDQCEFVLLMKYAADKVTSRPDYMSWQFTLSPNEIQEISRILSTPGQNLQMVLFCGDKNFDHCTYAVLNRHDLSQIHERSIFRFTVSIQPSEKYFRISLGNGRRNAILIPARRKVGQEMK